MKQPVMSVPKNWAPFNEKAVEYINRSLEPTTWMSVLEGGKRGGKNVANCILFGAIIDSSRDGLFLAAGVSQGTAKMNILDSDGLGLSRYFKGRCSVGKYQGIDCLQVHTPKGLKHILFTGGGRSTDYKRIKGFSFGAVYITEANECDLVFIRECLDRTLSSYQRKIIIDFNPKPIRHRFYREFLNEFVEVNADCSKVEYRVDGVVYEHFNIFDNMAIDDIKLAGVLSTYNKTSAWYQSDILGKRVSSTGLIYPEFGKNQLVTPEYIANKIRTREWGNPEYTIGIDVGGTDATVATLCGIFTTNNSTRNHTKVAVVLDGFYHKQGNMTGMTYDSYAKLIVSRIKNAWLMQYPKLSLGNMWVESADKLFRQTLITEMQRQGMSTLHSITVNPSYKDDSIVNRIRFIDILINQNRFFINSTLENWITAYSECCWDAEEFNNGEWVRVDNGSYPVDCLDSTEYALIPYKQDLL